MGVLWGVFGEAFEDCVECVLGSGFGASRGSNNIDFGGVFGSGCVFLRGGGVLVWCGWVVFLGWSLELWCSTWVVVSCDVILRRGDLLGLLVSGTGWSLELNGLRRLLVSGAVGLRSC